MELEDLPERVGSRVTETVEGLRDRTADVVRADGGSVFRELAKLGRTVHDSESAVRSRIDDVEDSLATRLADAEDTLGDRLDEVIAGDRRTTWPRRVFWVAVGLAAGAVTAYLADPDRGRARRAQLSDQVAARGRDLAEEVAGQAKVAADRTKGQLIEQAKEILPDDVPDDPSLLEQRIKSEVFGVRQDTTQVVLRIDAPGVVALKGTVPTATSERELISAVADVDGVIEVSSELNIRST